MSLRNKLQRLSRGVVSAAPVRAESAVDAPEARGDEAAWPFEIAHNRWGRVDTLSTRHEAAAHYGRCRLAAAREADGDTLAALCLDPALGDVDPTRLVFIDTETTGLSGGTGTLPFLLGAAFFEGDTLVVRQWLVVDPDDEAAALGAMREHLEAASAVVSYNGKAFDLPLLRDRAMLAGLEGLPVRPHVDLLHVARRVYGARVASVTLTEIEREVLGHHREDDVAGADIPERYRAFVKHRSLDPLRPVLKHHADDLRALAALLGELSARYDADATEARHDAHDALGLARTAFKAGRSERALRLIDHAVAQAAREGYGTVAREAHLVAARIYQQRKDPAQTAQHLTQALALDPDNPSLHLQLSRLYEKALRDPILALRHAERAHGAEDPNTLLKRLQRLRREAARGIQLALPFDR